MQFKKISASADNIITGVYRINRLRLVSGTGVATAIIFDGTQSTGVDFCKLVCGSGDDSDKESFGLHEGIVTTTGISVTLTGTNAKLYIYYS